MLNVNSFNVQNKIYLVCVTTTTDSNMLETTFWFKNCQTLIAIIKKESIGTKNWEMKIFPFVDNEDLCDAITSIPADNIFVYNYEFGFVNLYKFFDKHILDFEELTISNNEIVFKPKFNSMEFKKINETELIENLIS